MAGNCGTCTLCCKLIGVQGEVRGVPIKKPRADWCEHCAIGVGCKVYEDRPNSCIEFKCLWLQSMEKEEEYQLPPEMRPDRCGVVFSPSTSENAIAAHMDKHKKDAWKREPAKEWIRLLVLKGFYITLDYGDYSEYKTVLQRQGNKVTARRRRFTPPDKDGLQWSVVE